MVGLIVRRLLIMIPLLLIVSFIVFSLVVLIPGDAAVTLAGGIDATPEGIEEVRQELNLDDPFLQRYFDWLGGVLQGDFGESLDTKQPISDEIQKRLPVTMSIVGLALALAIPFAVIIGVIGGLRPGSLVDRILMVLTSIGLSLPTFWVGLILVTLLAVQLGWLPPFGYTKFKEDPGEWFKHAIMPAIAIALPAAMSLSRQVRAGLADTMLTQFIRTAWAKGGNTKQVVVGHALKNSAIPAVTVLGLQIGALLGGSVIIEQIFSIPGMGTYLLNAVNTQDFPVIQAVDLLFVVIHVFDSLAVDITYGYLNPKVRTE